MATLDAYLTKEDQLCAAIKAVRAVLPLPKKRVMGKLTHDCASELMCASRLMFAIGMMQHSACVGLEARLFSALRDAEQFVRNLGPEYSNLSGPEVSLAITDIAVRHLSSLK